jgi:hypothetical protein
MKVAQLREVLESAAQLHRGSGNAAAALSLEQLASLCGGHEALTVARFAALIAKPAGDGDRN